MNALQSGLHAESLIVRGEDSAALAQLSAEYHAEWIPVTPRERDLVDTLVHNQWLIRRLRLAEADMWAYHFENRDENFNPKSRFHDCRRRHALADGFQSMEKSLARLQSRLNSLERGSRAAVKELRQLQAGRQCLPRQPEPLPEPIDRTAGCAGIGFVPSKAAEPGFPPQPALPDRAPGPPAAGFSPGGGMPPC